MKPYLVIIRIFVLMAFAKVASGGAAVYSGIGSDFYEEQTPYEMSFVQRTLMDIDT
jgi:hypothetical protein